MIPSMHVLGSLKALCMPGDDIALSSQQIPPEAGWLWAQSALHPGHVFRRFNDCLPTACSPVPPNNDSQLS